jgi:hypothetical protein
VLGFLTVPLSYFSVNLFRSLHQTQSVRPDGWQIESGEIVTSMLTNVAAYTLVYLVFVTWRTSQGMVPADTGVGSDLAGDAVVAPSLGGRDE